MTKIARGERNNNPGNIRQGERWQGLCEKQTDNEFCQFISPEYGIRALYKLLQNYQKKYGLNTIDSIINRYAPANENNTSSYIFRVEKEIGIQAKRPIDTQQKNTVIPLARAIITIELGYQPYSERIFEQAWSLL